MNDKIPVILDGDPGHDDALAWLIAQASDKLEIKAVTTVAGNKDIDNVTNNALRVCSLLGITAPVAKGARGPLVVPGITAGSFHGETGLDGVTLPEPCVQLSDMSAVELMIKVLEESEEPVVIIGTGAETNLASLISARDDLIPKIKAFYLMGGGIMTGNWTPAAEFNILVDPEAADIVFTSGVPIVLSGLDVTEKALVYPDDIKRIRALGTPISEIAACWLDFFGATHAAMGYTGWPLHDPCAVLSLIHPELFTLKRTRLSVCTKGLIARGATLSDDSDPSRFNGIAVVDTDRPKFVDALISAIAAYGDRPVYAAGIPVRKETGTTGPARVISDVSLVNACRSGVRPEVPDGSTLVAANDAGMSVMAFMRWPELPRRFSRIIYAGGTLCRKRDDEIHPFGMEALLNCGVPVTLCTREAAAAHGCTPPEMAKELAGHPERFSLTPCGVHVETDGDSPACGFLISDRYSDRKFDRQNALIAEYI